MIVGLRASVCGYAEDCAPSLIGSGARPLLAKCDPLLRPAGVLEGSIASSLPLVTMSLLDVVFLHGTGAGAA